MEKKGREAGFTMVAIVLGMMILAIVIMGVAPAVATVMKRERGKELLFRGKQYARAIALFQKRYGRFPNELKELYENRPRTIRKLWKEPMCNCPDWHVIYQNSPDALNPGAGGSGLPGARPLPTPTPGAFGPTGQTKTVGPIVGVRSSVHEEALTEWRRRSRHPGRIHPDNAVAAGRASAPAPYPKISYSDSVVVVIEPQAPGC